MRIYDFFHLISFSCFAFLHVKSSATLMYMCFHRPQSPPSSPSERKRIAYKSSQDSGVDPDPTMAGRLIMEEDMSITISKVMVEDERTYICQVSAGPVGFSEAQTKVKVFCKSD